MMRPLPYLIAFPLVLAFLAVLSRPLFGISGAWIAPAALVLLGAACFRLRKKPYGFSVSILASAIGLSAGAFIGFLVYIGLRPHPLGANYGWLTVGKYALGVIVLSALLRRIVKHSNQLNEAERALDAKLESLEPEQQAVEIVRFFKEVEARIEAFQRANKAFAFKLLVVGAVLSVVAAVVIFSPRA